MARHEATTELDEAAMQAQLEELGEQARRLGIHGEAAAEVAHDTPASLDLSAGREGFQEPPHPDRDGWIDGEKPTLNYSGVEESSDEEILSVSDAYSRSRTHLAFTVPMLGAGVGRRRGRQPYRPHSLRAGCAEGHHDGGLSAVAGKA